MPHTFQIEEHDRQMLILGLALMSIQRPGFIHACREIAATLQGEEMFDDFTLYNTPPCTPPRSPNQPARSPTASPDASSAHGARLHKASS